MRRELYQEQKMQHTQHNTHHNVNESRRRSKSEIVIRSRKRKICKNVCGPRLDKPLKSYIYVRGFKLNLEYEGLTQFASVVVELDTKKSNVVRS